MSAIGASGNGRGEPVQLEKEAVLRAAIALADRLGFPEDAMVALETSKHFLKGMVFFGDDFVEYAEFIDIAPLKELVRNLPPAEALARIDPDQWDQVKWDLATEAVGRVIEWI